METPCVYCLRRRRAQIENFGKVAHTKYETSTLQRKLVYNLLFLDTLHKKCMKESFVLDVFKTRIVTH